MLTKGAIGNLVNKYRAVLKKCRLLNLFGTLALTGALTVGAAGMAGAAPVPAPWDGETVTIGTSKTENVSTLFDIVPDKDQSGGKNVATTTLTIDGGALSLSNGARLVHYNYDGQSGVTTGMDVTMKSGSLAVDGSSAYTSMDVNTARIEGGTVELTGKAGAAWENAAYIGAYKGMDITGGTVNMQVNSELFAGNHFSITGGTINMQGTDTSGGFGNNAAHIMFTSENTIGGTAVINVDAGKYGVMSAPTLDMTGGKLNVNGNLLLQPDTGARGGSVVYDGSAADGKSGVFNLSSGDVTVAKNGALYAPYTQINQEGGTLTVNGTLWTEKPDGSADGTLNNFSYTNSGYSLSDGKLVVKGDASVNNGGHGQLNGDMQVGNLEISGGTVEIGLAEGGSVTAWDNGPRLGGYGVNNENQTNISGGTVTLGTSGVLFAGVDANWAGGQMNLSGDAKIVMDGTNSVLYASSTDAGTDFVSLNISDNAGITVNAGKTGYILARETNMSGGSIDVAGALTVAGKSKKGGALDAGLAGVTKGGAFNLSGGAITVADKGKLNFATGEVNATLTGGSVTYNGGADGQLAFHGLTLAGGALNGVDSLTVDSSAAAKGVSASGLTVGSNAAKADLTLATLTQKAGAVAVNNGSLTVDSLNQSGGTLTVGGAGADGKLTVTGTTAGTSLKTVAVAVNNLGTLDVQSVVTGTFSGDVFSLNASVAQVGVNAGGTLKVNGFTEMSKAAFSDMKGKLVTGDGLLDLGSTKITGLVATDTSGNKTVAFDDVKDGGSTGGVKNDETLQATITGASSATSLTGGYNKVVTSDSLKTESGTLQLAGNANGGNIVDKSGTAADISVGDNSAAKDAVVTLGTSDADNSGKVGNVTLAVNSTGTATLNAVGSGNAFFSTGTIEGKGAVNAAGATLTADSIGAATAVAEVNGIGGTVVSNGVIKTDTLAADNGIVKATGNITVTNTVTGLNNGKIRSAKGDVTLIDGASNASGAIVADMGDIKTTNAGITVADGAELIVASGKAINVGSGDIAATNVQAGTTITAADVTATNVQAKTLTASGDVTVTDGVLNTTDASSVGSLALNNASGVVGELTAGATTLSNGSSLSAEKLIMSGDLTVGSNADTKGGTTLVVDALNLGGNDLLIDPAWGTASTNVAVGSFTGPSATDVEINGNVGVGMNSMAAIGTTDTSWLAGQVNAATNGAGLTENGVDSALGIYTAQVLDGTAGTGHGIVVDGTKTSSGGTAFTFTPNQLDFSGKSLLVVSADAALDPEGALSSNTASGVVNLTNGAKLRIAGAKIGEQYTVLGTNLDSNIAYKDADGNATTEADSTAWVGANLSTDSKLVHLEKSATGEYKGALTSAAAFMPKLDGELVKVVNNMALAGNTGAAGEMSETKGVRFLNRAISPNYLNNDAAAAVTIESAARMALVGAVPQMTMAASNAAGNAVTQRTGLAQPGGNAIQSMGTDGSMQTGASAGDAAKTGFAMWIMPLYQSSNGFGMKAGNFDMDFSGGLGGVAIGADYTFDNAIRAGITFNIGGGYAQGSGDLNETTNNMNFWGIGAYAGWTPGNFGLTADVNYTSTYNKLEQDLPASMQMGKLKSDVTAYAISAGLRGEYKIETSALDITPHAGVRYMSLNTDEYDVKSGGTLLKGDAINQSIWTFPIGVAFSKQIETGNGWHFKPSLDLAVIPAAGDIDARSDVRFTGTGTKAELDTQTMDYISYMGGLGLEFGNDTTSLGVNYNIQLGAKSTAHGVFGTFRYEF
ncbi:hypothetical protein CE91St38_21050 [Desulfovibrionaceae bacterium]|nr:hypothetical protein CE91St38_21050 [Desulfovibrionaceae bacterium]GKI12647.1 hypothetical protein CE91St39_21010 [Desulfovibrionaceae bacterium]